MQAIFWDIIYRLPKIFSHHHVGDHFKGLPVSPWEQPLWCHHVFPSFKALFWFSLFLVFLMTLTVHLAFCFQLLQNGNMAPLSHIKIHDFWNGSPNHANHFEVSFEMGIKYNFPFQMSLFLKWENDSCFPFTSYTRNGVLCFPILCHSY